MAPFINVSTADGNIHLRSTSIIAVEKNVRGGSLIWMQGDKDPVKSTTGVVDVLARVRDCEFPG